MSSPDLTGAEIEAVNQVLATRHLSLGPRLVEFEQQFARAVGVAHAVGVNSGTSGLHLAVIAAGIGEGDLVITSPFSFVASANCLLYERAVPVFVDIDPDTLNLDPALVAAAAAALAEGGPAALPWLPPNLRNDNSGAGSPFAIRHSSFATFRGHLKALLPVHAFGQPADMDPLLETARRYDLAVIEDACEAIGAEYRGRQAGRLGDAAVFAFYPNKQMTTGEGGMIVTDNETWADLFRSLRNQGRDVFDAWLNHSRLGYNYRLDELSAALGLAQVDRLSELLAHRARVAGWYNQRLRDVDGVRRPYVAPTTSRMSWFVYVIRLDPEIDREQVMARLAGRGIPARPYFSPIHLQPFYRQRFGYRPGDFPVTETVARSTLALPFFGTMTEQQVDTVCAELRAALATPAVLAVSLR